jgi:hypothetical protein
MAYTPTTWVNRVTTLGPTNLNKLEQGVANAAAVADSAMSAGADAIPSTQKGAANGIASLDANGHVPAAQQAYYGTVPPPGPQDGDEWIFPADATAGVMWRFRYNAVSASAYKWEFVGGADWISTIVGNETSTVRATWFDLATVGPRIFVPRAGDYLFTFSITASDTLGGAQIGGGVALTPTGNGAPQTLNSPWGANQNMSVVGMFLATGLTASQEIRLRYVALGAAGTATFVNRTLTARPVRIS